MTSDHKIGERLMGWGFVLMGLCLLGLAVYFLNQGYVPGRDGLPIDAGTLRFMILETVVFTVGLMGVLAGGQMLRRLRHEQG
ncbi:hypothetical protein [Ottowia sp.]|uniref:hypothetical protein n=1 Tax=Ottowia sp. TaxID=1898956 RepID=UPI003A850256